MALIMVFFDNGTYDCKKYFADGEYIDGQKHGIKSGEYKIYFFDELKISEKIYEHIIPYMEAGWVLDRFKSSAQAGKEYFKNDIENGILKNIVKFNKDTNEYVIDRFFEKKFENYKVEVALISRLV